MSKAAIVSFSGGQDSTTCLFWALKNFDRVETVGFNYGQKNNVELICRKEILKKFRLNFLTLHAALALTLSLTPVPSVRSPAVL